MCLEKVCHSVIYCVASLRGRRLKGKGKGVLGARETRGTREEGLAPKFPFPSLSNACHAGYCAARPIKVILQVLFIHEFTG